MRKLLLALALTSFSVAAQAATYVDTRTVGDATAQLSITTDDTIGVLAKANIVDWTITLTRGARTTTLFGPGDDNSSVDVSGVALTATATQLLFDFGGADNSYLFFMNTDTSDISTFRSLWTVQTSGAFTSFRNPEEVIRLGFLPDSDPYIGREGRSGVQVIASTVSAPVPEPATWLSMILGFGVTGAALRRRRQAALGVA